MQKIAKYFVAAACSFTALAPPGAAQARVSRHVTTHHKRSATRTTPYHPAHEVPAISPTSPLYDEIQFVVDRSIMPLKLGGFQTSLPLTVTDFEAALGRLHLEYLHRGLTDLPPVPKPDLPWGAVLTREQAVDMLVKTLDPPGKAATWTPDVLAGAVSDYAQVSQPYQATVALAAEKLLLPNPLNPSAPADQGFAAEILARAIPWGSAVPAAGPFVDEIRKALSLHLFYSIKQFPDSSLVTTAQLARAITRARMYLPADRLALLPALPVSSTDHHYLTRLEAIRMVVMGLVVDSHLDSQLAVHIDDPACRVCYAMGPSMYLSKLDDAAKIPSDGAGVVSVAAYKGWLPNLSSEPGVLNLSSEASLGYVANLLARAVDRPGDYTGILLDMSSLTAIPRSGGMWIISAGDSTDTELPTEQVYPASGHAPIRPFYSAPGALAYYGDVSGAEEGRAGKHPLILHPLDWAQYDWTTLHGDPGLRRGGGTAVPLNAFHFVHGTPPLILLTTEDAAKLQELDKKSLLLRMGRMSLVAPNWSMTAMR